jgi:DNA-binding NarL/FixJ family response regulator
VIGVLVVDDQRLLRDGLRMLLGLADGIAVVAEAGEGHEALAMIDKYHPDVVLTDARMPGMDGIDLVAACRVRHPRLPVLVLTTFDDEDVVLGSLGAGAAGFLLKDVSPERLAEAVTAAARGEIVIDPRVARLVVQPRASTAAAADDPLAVLTRTERVVAEHLAHGRTNTEIADAMVLAEGTVKNHVSSLLRKFGQRDRTGLALLMNGYFISRGGTAGR